MISTKILCTGRYIFAVLNRESYMSANVLLNLLNKLGKNAKLAKHFISFWQRV